MGSLSEGGALRERFWELDLKALNRAEWEALCDGCGRCCLNKLEDEDTGEIVETNVACKLLDTATGRCSNYRHRRAFVPDCLQLTPRIVENVQWLPESCTYRLRAEGQALPEWHHLLTGSTDAMIAAGACVAGRCVSEIDAGPLEHHITSWGMIG